MSLQHLLVIGDPLIKVNVSSLPFAPRLARHLETLTYYDKSPDKFPFVGRDSSRPGVGHGSASHCPGLFIGPGPSVAPPLHHVERGPGGEDHPAHPGHPCKSPPPPRCASALAINVSPLMEVDVCVTTLEHHP